MLELWSSGRSLNWWKLTFEMFKSVNIFLCRLFINILILCVIGTSKLCSGGFSLTIVCFLTQGPHKVYSGSTVKVSKQFGSKCAHSHSTMAFFLFVCLLRSFEVKQVQ